MHFNRKLILSLVILVPVGLLILLFSYACQAQDGPPPTPELIPAEPVEALQDKGVIPAHPDTAGLALFKTVGADPISDPRVDCPTTESVNVAAGTQVYFCYRVANTGTITLTSHTLVDDQLGTILNNRTFMLPAGASAVLTRTEIISKTTVNAAIWTASDAGGTNTVAAYDRAGAFVSDSQPLACGSPAVNFDQGIPKNWTVISTPGDSRVYWTNVGLSWETGNYTGGAGDAASASSRYQNGGSGIYNTELRSPAFSLNGAGAVVLHYLANYQHNANDALDLDISTNGGDSWVTLRHWNSIDHGSSGGTPGEAVEVDLSNYSGKPSLLLRWHYYNQLGPVDSKDLYAEIDQVSLQCETNAAIELKKTAGTDPVCATAVNLVPPGTRMTYCYTATNTGPTALTLHDLVDSQQGSLLTNYNAYLAPVPGASAILRQPVTILTDTTTTATWSASNPVLGVSAKASDTLVVKVGRPVFLPFISFKSVP